ncbi:hypothetical protein [Nostoc sp. UHCC 0870]|uniref:hypothetical protein n=1 Tax=Nostoc sp. UHCC 0870 TaxID=2914041 RepID=UPI001EDCED21|nr:hypothetical protein [Nostoc sp. UHCC 0870]UKO99709.1 hypothetical protein L6494_08400 [Nostoc sp. UHCC 0870]
MKITSFSNNLSLTSGVFGTFLVQHPKSATTALHLCTAASVQLQPSRRLNPGLGRGCHPYTVLLRIDFDR